MSLTTREKEQAALAIPCPLHGVPAGDLCQMAYGAMAGLCMPRRDAALREDRTEGSQP